MTFETYSTIQYLDPQVSYDIYGAAIQQNVYEPLLWFNGTNGVTVVPWLAQSYTVASNGLTANFTLRQGITFADGEQFNSTAVYFAFDRLLVFDGSAPLGHGTQASWILQQLENKSLSTFFSGPQNYSSAWTGEVLAQDFVQITGPYSVTLHIQNPNAALPYLIANLWANMVAPDYTMQKDLSMWSQPSNGYSLPYPSPSGNATQIMNEYYYDFVATCNAGATPRGCAQTYLDGSYQGSLAGTGPYTIQSVGQSSNDIVLKANPTYWGGPNHIKAQIPTIYINYVPDQSVRDLDIENAAKSGQAFAIDITNDHLYDIADRSQWLDNGKLVSDIPGISIYGTYTQYATWFDPFGTNVTDQYTGTYYTFQPFADIRMRLAFADAVNLTDVNVNVNNKLGQVANELLPPGFPPNGSYNASVSPVYSYNLTAVQNLLLSAMETPITHFTFYNGTAAPPGVFNDTFGCTASNLAANGGTCKDPVAQTITLVYATGDTVDEDIYTDIAGAINNVSSTYNMGLTVDVTPVPLGQLTTEAFSGQVYSWAEAPFGWYDDYPWATDFLGPILSPGGIYTAPGGWNLTAMQTLWNQAEAGTETGNNTEVAQAANAMSVLANQEVMDIWTFYPAIVTVMTSNVHGFYFNPAIYTTGGGMPQYFAALY